MIVDKHEDGSVRRIQASGQDTYKWAHRPGHRWPASTLSNCSLVLEFQENGDLVDVEIKGREHIDFDEVQAFTSDVRNGTFT